MSDLVRDSAVLIIRATGDGYFVSVYQWGISPPPTDVGHRLGITNPLPSLRIDRIAMTKVELKAEFSNYVDTLFDV